MTNTESVKNGLKLANSFEQILSQQTGVLVQLAVKATTQSMENPEMSHYLEDTLSALTFARASGMLFIALAKNHVDELELDDAVLAEMEQLKFERERILAHLNREME